MKEYKIIGYTFLFFIGIFFVVYFFTVQKDMPKNPVMPWHSYVDADRNTHIFGLTLGKSTLLEAMHLFGQEVEASLFEQNERPAELEVFFSSTKIGGIGARVVLNLEANAQQIEQLKANTKESMLMPSGIQKTTFKSVVDSLMIGLNIKVLTFVPKADLPIETIKVRFGEPNHIEQASNVQYWHYPEKGLRIIVSETQKEILEFFNR
jgi:hypothetical protein